MGDRRFDVSYEGLTASSDRMARLRKMTDEEVVHALAAASRKMDAYLANVLAVEVLNRQRRQRARLVGVAVGLGVALALRTALVVAGTTGPASPLDEWLWLTTLLALAPAGLLGLLTYRWTRSRGPS